MFTSILLLILFLLFLRWISEIHNKKINLFLDEVTSPGGSTSIFLLYMRYLIWSNERKMDCLSFDDFQDEMKVLPSQNNIFDLEILVPRGDDDLSKCVRHVLPEIEVDPIDSFLVTDFLRKNLGSSYKSYFMYCRKNNLKWVNINHFELKMKSGFGAE